jgi:hypothetical protein
MSHSCASEMTIKPPPRILLGDAAKPSSSQPDAGQTSVKVSRWFAKGGYGLGRERTVRMVLSALARKSKNTRESGANFSDSCLRMASRSWLSNAKARSVISDFFPSTNGISECLLALAELACGKNPSTNPQAEIYLAVILPLPASTKLARADPVLLSLAEARKNSTARDRRDDEFRD